MTVIGPLLEGKSSRVAVARGLRAAVATLEWSRGRRGGADYCYPPQSPRTTSMTTRRRALDRSMRSPLLGRSSARSGRVHRQEFWAGPRAMLNAPEVPTAFRLVPRGAPLRRLHCPPRMVSMSSLHRALHTDKEAPCTCHRGSRGFTSLYDGSRWRSIRTAINLTTDRRMRSGSRRTRRPVHLL